MLARLLLILIVFGIVVAAAVYFAWRAAERSTTRSKHVIYSAPQNEIARLRHLKEVRDRYLSLSDDSRRRDEYDEAAMFDRLAGDITLRITEEFGPNR